MSPLAVSLRFLQTQPDARLVALAQAGHERAFEALVRRYRSQLLAYCRRVAPRGTAPEDILQQGLLQAWKALSDGSEVRDARAWLYRIVHNVAISALRATGDLSEGVIPGPGSPGVEQVVEQRMAARDALAGLAALPDLQRQVMVSTALDGQSHEQIAAALGLTSGSVRGLIYRARCTLRSAAAAVIPAPVIEWAVGDVGGTTTGLAGAGSAGLGALILKGGAIVAVGAVAGTAAIVAGHRSGHAHPSKASVVASTASAAGDGNAASGHQTAGAAHNDAILAAIGVIGSARGAASRTGGRDRSGDGGSRLTGSGGDGSRRGSDGGGGDGGSTTTSGTGGGDHGGSTTTSGSGGGDHGGSTTTSSSDGGGTNGATTATSGSDGGSTSTSGSSSSSSDGGSSGSSDGGGGSGTTVTTTTTSPTTTTTVPIATGDN